MLEVDIVVVALSSPVLIGVYRDDELLEEISSKEYVSEVLPLLFRDILKKYKIKRLFFAKGPGSFMSIKLVYVFLKTLSITKDIELLATDAFYFNENAPIKALKDRYFVKKEDKITIEKISANDVSFKLPKVLDTCKFSSDIKPLYILPAI